MFLEIGRLQIKPDMSEQFETAMKPAMAIMSRAKGCKSGAFYRSIERPSRYYILNTWESIENHTIDFRLTRDYLDWRKLVAPYFTGPAIVEHVELLSKDF